MKVTIEIDNGASLGPAWAVSRTARRLGAEVEVISPDGTTVDDLELECPYCGHSERQQ